MKKITKTQIQPIFSRNIDIDKIAFLNWRFDSDGDLVHLLNLADGFLMSAIELTKKCLKNNNHKRADILIFPILANTNHGIELYLKSLIGIFNAINLGEFKIEKGHNIKQLYETAKAKSQLCEDKSIYIAFKDATTNLKHYILELFEKVDALPGKDKMDFPRYPFSTDNSAHFYVNAMRNVEIDLENFVTRFKKIKKDLDNFCDFLQYNVLNQEW
jgi:hypothetical protein